VSMDIEPRGPGLAGEYIVEVIGPDGLKHHVGPFRVREEAENWIARNPPDLVAADGPDKKGRSKKKSRSRRSRFLD
jgi:hypothetical protein